MPELVPLCCPQLDSMFSLLTSVCMLSSVTRILCFMFVLIRHYLFGVFVMRSCFRVDVSMHLCCVWIA